LIDLAKHFKKLEFFTKYVEKYFLEALYDPSAAIRGYLKEDK